MTKIIRHKIDPVLVKTTIEAKVQEYERMRAEEKKRHAENLVLLEKHRKEKTVEKNWTKVPSTQRKHDKEIDKMYDEWIKHERTHYALVRVIEGTPIDGKSFYLVYGKDKDESKGTGPFISPDKAKDWFLKQGR